jgi:hypothetical protein
MEKKVKIIVCMALIIGLAIPGAFAKQEGGKGMGGWFKPQPEKQQMQKEHQAWKIHQRRSGENGPAVMKQAQGNVDVAAQQQAIEQFNVTHEEIMKKFRAARAATKDLPPAEKEAAMKKAVEDRNMAMNAAIQTRKTAMTGASTTAETTTAEGLSEITTVTDNAAKE